jgi:HEPN domain-containing protein
MTPALSAYIKTWIEKAEHDLMSAQRLLEIEPMILDNACFHCQQAVEKCLKAFLISFIYYHNAQTLILLLQQLTR